MDLPKMKYPLARPNRKLLFPDGELTESNLAKLCKIFDTFLEYHQENYIDCCSEDDCDCDGDLFPKDCDCRPGVDCFCNVDYETDLINFDGLMAGPVGLLIKDLIYNSDSYLMIMSLLYKELVRKWPDHEIHHALKIQDSIEEAKNNPDLSEEERQEEINTLKLFYPHASWADPYKHDILKNFYEEEGKEDNSD